MSTRSIALPTALRRWIERAELCRGLPEGLVSLLRFNRLRPAVVRASAPRYVLMAACVASLLLLTEVMDPWSRPFVPAVGLILVGTMVLLMLVDGVPVRSEMRLLWLGVLPAAIALAVPNESWRSDWGYLLMFAGVTAFGILHRKDRASSSLPCRSPWHRE